MVNERDAWLIQLLASCICVCCSAILFRSVVMVSSISLFRVEYPSFCAFRPEITYRTEFQCLTASSEILGVAGSIFSAVISF